MSRPKGYLVNVVWSWLSYLVSLTYGFVLFPMLIRYLGAERYGIWDLAGSLVESLWMIDIGFRAGTVKLCAEFRAHDRDDQINGVINTALAYSVAVSAVVVGVVWFRADRIAAFYSRITDPAFPFLIRATVLSFALGLIFNIFAAALEGFHRFDLSTRAGIIRDLLRIALSIGVIKGGYGLREMGWVLLISQGVCYLLWLYFCRATFPELKISPLEASRAMAKRLVGYVRQVAFGMLSDRLTNFAIPSWIGKTMSSDYIGYYTRLRRLPDYGADVVSRVGLVTAPRVTAMFARGELKEIVKLTEQANRYCLLIWGCAAAFLFVYGQAFCTVWVTPTFGEQAATVLPYLVFAYTLWMGQFISAAVLMGIERYGKYSAALAMESVCEVIAVMAVVPEYGIGGAARVIATGIVLIRFLFLSKCFAVEFQLSQFRYLAHIYTGPMTLIAVGTGGLWLLREFAVPGKSWLQLIGVALVFSALYLATAALAIVPREHRELVLQKIRSRT